MTGVIPLPAVMNRSDSGGGFGSAKSPLGDASRMMVPGSTPLTRWADKKPSGVAFTVIEMFSSPRSGTEVSEYDRQCHLPSTRRPMPTYWPGR